MAFTEIAYMQDMTAEQRLLFQSQYGRAQKNRTIGLLLAFFLGSFGAHRFYLGEVGLGILYAVFFWTFIPGIVALVELFLIGARVDRFNESTAQELAARIRMLGPASVPA
jgi:TM2 domain-containing membrane protein YozV